MSLMRRERLVESSWLSELSSTSHERASWSHSSDWSTTTISMRTESGWHVLHVRDKAEDCTLTYVEYYES